MFPKHVKQSLWKMGFTPKVFKKFKSEHRSKGVDIALTKDVLSHAFRDHFEVAMIVAGDRDYLKRMADARLSIAEKRSEITWN